MVVTVDVDPKKWEREYGDKPINGQLWQYFYDVLDTAVFSSGARYTVKELKIR